MSNFATAMLVYTECRLEIPEWGPSTAASQVSKNFAPGACWPLVHLNRT